MSVWNKILIILIIIALGAAFYFSLAQNEANLKLAEVIINDQSITVEIADSAALKQIGLGGRDYLPENQGMLFVFEQQSRPVFWMKGMEFPLDIIWIADNRVVDLTKDALVEIDQNNLTKYRPTKPVNYVLEVNAGFIDNNNIKIGDPVDILFKN